MAELRDLKYGGARALVIQHERQLRKFSGPAGGVELEIGADREQAIG